MQSERPQLTEDQKLAADPSNTPAVIEAGAGSGKTTVLIERTFNILEKNSDLTLENILLITFTENAVHDIKKKLLERTDAKASVYTFHGFANLILKENPAFFELDPHFQISDEVTTLNNFRLYLIDFLKNNIEKDRDLKEILNNIILIYPPEQLFNLLYSIYSKRNHFLTQHSIDEIISYYKNYKINEASKSLLSSIKKNSYFIKHIGCLEKIRATKETDILFQIRSELLEDLKKSTDLISFSKITIAPLKGGSKNNYFDVSDFENLKAGLKYFKSLISFLNKFSLENNFKITFDIFTLYKKFDLYFTSIKKILNLLDFTDLETEVLKIKNSSYLKKFYRGKYPFVVVDEFQDTSLIQKELLLSIFDEKKLVFIGDPKQSIYKFRNAEVSLFSEVKSEIIKSGKEIILNKNFRSHPNLIYFFNLIFDKIFSINHNDFETESLTASLSNYANTIVTSQALWEKENYGPVNSGLIHILSYPTQNEDSFTFESGLIVKQINEYIKLGYMLNEIAILLHSTTHVEKIETALKNASIPYYLFDSKGFFQNFEILDLINFFKCIDDLSNNFNFISLLKSLFFNFSDEDLVFIKENSHEQSYYNKLKDLAKNDSRFENVIKIINEFIYQKDKISYSELFSKAISLPSFHKALRMRKDPHLSLANLKKLILYIKDFEENHEFENFKSLLEYLNKLQNENLRIGNALIFEDSQDAIKIMTIHKSKGLEFKNVIIPFMSALPPLKSAPFIFRKDMPSIKDTKNEDDEKKINIEHFKNSLGDKLDDYYESLRLFYVAMTRAKNNLTLIGKFIKSKEEGSSLKFDWFEHLIYIFNLDETSREFIHKDNITYKTNMSQTQRIIEIKFNYEFIKELKSHDLSLPDFNSCLSDLKEPLPPVKNELKEISVIALQQYLNCSYYFYLRYVVKIPEDLLPREKIHFTNTTFSHLTATDRGKVLHKFFEKSAHEHTDLQTNLTEALSYFGIEVEEKELSLLSEEALKSFSSDYFNSLNKSDTKYTEFPFLLKLKSNIKGTIDRIDIFPDKIFITDYKTSREENRDKFIEKYRIQADIYALALSHIFPRHHIYFNFFFTDNCETHSLNYDKEKLQSCTNYINQVIDQIANEEYTKIKINCHFCPYSKLCQDEK